MIAELVLEGFMDEETGEIIDGTSPGYPRRLSDPEFRVPDSLRFHKQPLKQIARAKRRPRTIPCPGCGRKFNSPDARDLHQRTKEH